MLLFCCIYEYYTVCAFFSSIREPTAGGSSKHQLYSAVHRPPTRIVCYCCALERTVYQPTLNIAFTFHCCTELDGRVMCASYYCTVSVNINRITAADCKITKRCSRIYEFSLLLDGNHSCLAPIKAAILLFAAYPCRRGRTPKLDADLRSVLQVSLVCMFQLLHCGMCRCPILAEAVVGIAAYVVVCWWRGKREPFEKWHHRATLLANYVRCPPYCTLAWLPWTCTCCPLVLVQRKTRTFVRYVFPDTSSSSRPFPPHA